MSNKIYFCNNFWLCHKLWAFSMTPKILVSYLDCLVLCRLFPISSPFILTNMKTFICFLNRILLRAMYAWAFMLKRHVSQDHAFLCKCVLTLTLYLHIFILPKHSGGFFWCHSMKSWSFYSVYNSSWQQCYTLVRAELINSEISGCCSQPRHDSTADVSAFKAIAVLSYLKGRLFHMNN